VDLQSFSMYIVLSAAECYTEYRSQPTLGEVTVGGDVTNSNSPAQESNEPSIQTLIATIVRPCVTHALWPSYVMFALVEYTTTIG
jgi:hypothetical protein